MAVSPAASAASTKEEVDILLINPPFFQTPADQSYSYYYPPLGLLYVGTVLKDKGYNVKIFNPVFEDKYITVGEKGYPPLSEEDRAEFKERFIGFPDSAEWLSMKSDLAKIKPKVVGITMMTPQYDLSILLARLIKEADPGIPVIVGGVHASALPNETIENDEFDVLVYGEGEETAEELMEAYIHGRKTLSSIKGIFYKDNGKIIRNEPRELIQNIDNLPFPMPDPVYEKHPRRAILTSRGCYFRCTFCSQSSILGRKVRFRSPKNVVDEIEFWYKRGVRQFILQDSTFTSDIGRSIEIVDMIVERKLKIKWGFQSRVNLLPRELVAKAKAAGCEYIWIGVESGDPAILKAIKKGITLDQVRAAVKLIKEFEMDTYLYFILGFVEDTKETMETTQEFAKELDCYQTSFFMLTPFPGSETFNRLAADDRLLSRDYFFYFWLYPYLIKRKDPSNSEVWNYYQEVKAFWANKKLEDVRRRSLQPGFVLRKIKENAYSFSAMSRLARKFVKAHVRPKEIEASKIDLPVFPDEAEFSLDMDLSLQKNTHGDDNPVVMSGDKTD